MSDAPRGSAACDGCGFKVCPALGQPCCDQCSHDQQRPASAAAVLAETLPILRRSAKHLDCEDCWYSCATLTCDDGRRSDECDCGAAEALRVLRQVEAVLA